MVHNHIAFDYQKADSTRSAFGGFNDRTGVCRDFAHLAITLCRAMNIPARYCTGYLGDIGVPADPAPMDFSAERKLSLEIAPIYNDKVAMVENSLPISIPRIAGRQKKNQKSWMRTGVPRKISM